MEDMHHFAPYQNACPWNVGVCKHVCRLSPLLLPDGSGWILRLRIQNYLRAGTLALRKGVVLGGVEAQALTGWVVEGMGWVNSQVVMLLWWIEAAAELEHLGRKWCITCDHFCAAVKHSVNLSTVGLNHAKSTTNLLCRKPLVTCCHLGDPLQIPQTSPGQMGEWGRVKHVGAVPLAVPLH